MKRREDSENINNKIKKLEGAVEDIQSKFELLNIENKELQKKITSLEGVKKKNNNKSLKVGDYVTSNQKLWHEGKITRFRKSKYWVCIQTHNGEKRKKRTQTSRKYNHDRQYTAIRSPWPIIRTIRR